MKPEDRFNYMDASRMSFGDHLEELRSRLIRALLGVAVATLLGFVFSDNIIQILFKPFIWSRDRFDPSANLLASAPQSIFLLYLKIAFLSGLILAMPWVLWQIWLFIATGLYPKEQVLMKRLAPISMGLFVAGALFVYFFVLPISMSFFLSFNRSFDSTNELAKSLKAAPASSDDVEGSPPPLGTPLAPICIPTLQSPPQPLKEGMMWIDEASKKIIIYANGQLRSPQWLPAGQGLVISSYFSVESYVSLALGLTLAFGLAFELPIVIVSLVWLDILRVEELARSRRYVILGVFFVAAVLTPPDIFSQLLMALPLLALFESGLWASRIIERRRRRAQTTWVDP